MVNLWKLMEHFYLFFCSWLKGFSVDWHRCDESKPCVSHSLIKWYFANSSSHFIWIFIPHMKLKGR
jgi:hypothetical protein